MLTETRGMIVMNAILDGIEDMVERHRANLCRVSNEVIRMIAVAGDSVPDHHTFPVRCCELLLVVYIHLFFRRLAHNPGGIRKHLAVGAEHLLALRHGPSSVT